MSRRLSGAATLALMLLAVWGACVARADVFGSIQLVSTGHLPGSGYSAQAGEARDAVLSQDGRYLAFDGSFGGRRGIFRRDLATGEVAVVAEGQAELPSISADGRYISFTTNERLDEENDTNESPDVYVRDMEQPSSAPCGPEWEQQERACAYTLASAENASTHGLQYSFNLYEYGSSEPQASIEHDHGSLATGRSAISADGQEVAFITTAGAQLQAGVPLPRGQVLVRFLQSRRTQLVSTVLGAGGETSEPVPSGSPGFFGAAFPGGENGTPAFPFTSPYVGASLSADGNAVAWLGTQIGLQAPELADERLEDNYTEPLWREVGEDGLGPMRRVTGGSDPTSTVCIDSGETSVPVNGASLSDPCQGPFGTFESLTATSRGTWTVGSEFDFVPQLSADGQTVAMLSDAHYLASGEELTASELSDDLYVVNMQPGLSRVQALTRLTALAGGGDNNPARTAPIVDLGVSPNGGQIAFSSARTVFPLGSPTLVSEAGSAQLQEIYDVDLQDSTLTRVTRGFEGQLPEAPAGADAAGSPSFSANGALLSFDSTEDNLVYGDGNAASDAFLVEREQAPYLAAPELLSSPPAAVTVAPAWRLSATASSSREGTVTLYVLVPGGGGLAALADARVKHPGAAPRTKLVTRIVASRSARASSPGLVKLVLRLSSRYQRLARRSRGLPATVALGFTAPGHAQLRYGVRVLFHEAQHKNGSGR